MAFNGSGTFVINSTGQPVVSNTVISATVFNAFTADIATGLTNCITKDGQQTVTANIPWNGNKITNLGNGSAASDAAAYGQLTSALGNLQGFIGGLTLSAAGSTGTFGIAAGGATDSTNALYLSIVSAFTKTTSNFVAGTGNGALDTGSIAATTWYHVFIIGAPGVASDILFSLSPTSPTLPAGYTLFRRIGSMLTDSSSHWVAFKQNGNYFRWSAAIYGDFSNTVSGTGQNITLTVPTGVVVFPDIGISIASEASTGAMGFLVTSLDEGNSSVTNSSATMWLSAAAAFTYYNLGGTAGNVHTNASAQIRGRSDGSSGAVLNINTNGWTDLRGSQ